MAAAIDDLCTFAGRTDLPLLPQCAIAHAQFETIHPFNDGNGRALAHELREVHTGWTTRVRARRGAAIWRALPLLLDQPVVTSALLQRQLGLSQPAADQVIVRLREAEIVTRATGRHRYVTWAATEVTAALDAFAERARRG